MYILLISIISFKKFLRSTKGKKTDRKKPRKTSQGIVGVLHSL